MYPKALDEAYKKEYGLLKFEVKEALQALQ